MQPYIYSGMTTPATQVWPAGGASPNATITHPGGAATYVGDFEFAIGSPGAYPYLSPSADYWVVLYFASVSGAVQVMGDATGTLTTAYYNGSWIAGVPGLKKAAFSVYDCTN